MGALQQNSEEVSSWQSYSITLEICHHGSLRVVLWAVSPWQPYSKLCGVSPWQPYSRSLGRCYQGNLTAELCGGDIMAVFKQKSVECHRVNLTAELC
jgi:hypothetical protein